MTRIISLVLVLFAPLSLCADDKDAARKELKALEGKWKAVSMEAGGNVLPKDSTPEFIFTVGPNGKSKAKTPQHDDQATISVDPTKNPRTIDNLHESGAGKGKTQYGIYKLEGDKWTVCMTLPGVKESDRPKSFSTKDTSNVIFVFERQRDGK